MFRYRFTAERGAATFAIVVFDENSGWVGRQSILVDGAQARVETLVDEEGADAAWREVVARAERERKPIVIFFRSRPCGRCRTFERATVPHPTIQRRLPEVVFAVLPATAGEGSRKWKSADAGVAFFDRSGALRARWPIVPDTTNLGIILDSVAAVAADFERAARLSETGASPAAEIEVANGLARLGRITDARAALTHARAAGNAEVRQIATVASAVLDANEGRREHALVELRGLTSGAATRMVAVQAWLAIGGIHRASGATADAIRAFETASELTLRESPQHAAAQQALVRLRGAGPAKSGLIHILPLGRQVVSGRETVRTHVGSASVARVSFLVDGREVRRVERPPFSTVLDFGVAPERHSIGVIAFDGKAREIGRDQRIVNEAGETFWLRLTAPREGSAEGAVRVAMNVRVPASGQVRRVVVSWNDAQRAVLTAAPWECSIDIPAGQLGVVRAVAELDDGRSSEDAVLLNAGGMVDHSTVQLVELPITVVGRNGTAPEVTADRIVVREAAKARRVEAVSTAAETPLTVGLLIDASDSMQSTLPDLQEAAIRFLETVLGERDRAFLVTFDTRARLIHPATSDLATLREQIMEIRPDGLTALHDAMVLGLLQFEGIKGRRAMIVFSDGLDRTSEYRASDVSELAKRVNVPIHFIASVLGVPAGLGGDTHASSGPRALTPEEGELQRMAASTGGTSHTLVELAELPGVYARIEALLRAQILAFFRSDPATRENEWRPLQVEVRGPDLDVYAPEGYYAAW
jgi:VWFA-related protein